ncbi:ASCH domain-containing protein [Trueperella sp. LYQ143]|uniref:ASCH domain-containing protein n=1 Tax=Trueperella sp. LYQ143 TaxID=3391059 RepID=UPI00398326F4
MVSEENYEVAEPLDIDAALDSFWAHAINAGRLYPIESVGGQVDETSLRPGSFSLGDTPQLADELAELIVSGAKRATSSYEPSYMAAGESLPSIGELWIVCDGRGYPRALIRNVDVRRIPFCDVGADIAEAEGEGDLPKWQADHEQIFREEAQSLGIEFDPQENVIVEFFRLLYASDAHIPSSSDAGETATATPTPLSSELPADREEAL